MAKVATTQLEEFRFRAEILWTNIRGKRYQPHERQALVDVLAPHSDVLVRLFGIDATALASEFDNVLAKLTRGLADGVSELRRLQTDTLDRVEELARDDHALGVGALIEKAFEDKDLATRRAKVMGEVFGMDLSDVGKNTALPQSLLDALSWLPGEDTDFFAPGAFSACPTLTPLPRYCDPISIPG